MALSKIRSFFGKTKESDKPSIAPQVDVPGSGTVEVVDKKPANIINFFDHFPQPDIISSEFIVRASEPAVQHQGLLDEPELKDYLDGDKYFRIGKHNGVNFPGEEARDLGCAQIIAGLQKILDRMISRRVSKLNKLQLQIVDVEASSPGIAKKVRFACSKVEEDISTLKVQMDLCAQGKGWALAPLNGYRLGFEHGVRVAFNYDLLSV